MIDAPATAAAAHSSADRLKNIIASPDRKYFVLDSNTGDISVVSLDGTVCNSIKLLNRSSAVAWHPYAAADDSRAVAVSAKDRPIVLYSALESGHRRQQIAAFLPMNHAEAVDCPLSVDFTGDGAQIVAGGFECLRVFAVCRPGSQHAVIKLSPSRASRLGLKGRVSAVTVRKDSSNIAAVGSFANSLGFVDLRSEEVIFQGSGRIGAVHQLAFSDDGWKLFSYARRDSSIAAWDLRTMSVCALIDRPDCCQTNQRLYFSCLGDLIGFGNASGDVTVWNHASNTVHYSKRLHNAPVSAVSIADEGRMLLSCSGHDLLKTEIENNFN